MAYKGMQGEQDNIGGVDLSGQKAVSLSSPVGFAEGYCSTSSIESELLGDLQGHECE